MAALALVVAAGGCSNAPGLLDGVGLAPRGHHDLSLETGGEAVPRVIGREDPFGVCLEAPPTRETSRWHARLWVGERGQPQGAFAPPAARMASTLCFETALARETSSGLHRLCIEVRDLYDGAAQRTDCVPFRFDERHPDSDRIRERLAELLGNAEVGLEPKIRELEALEQQAREPLPFLALRLRLISAYFLRRAGTAEARERARALVASFPDWIDDPAAARWKAQLLYERSTLALELAELEPAWRDLREAERSFRQVADPKRISAVMKQAEILARVGAVAEGRERLRFALAQCGDATCEERLVQAARITLAWLHLLDPDATRADLEQAGQILVRALESSAEDSSVLERANARVNLAYARERLGADPLPALAEARELLAGRTTEGAGRASAIADWARIIEALHRSNAGDASRALELCSKVVAQAASSRLRAWGLSCAASAHRARGELDRAAEAIDLALALHAGMDHGAFGQQLALGPGQRADDFYRAARLAVERGRPREAWDILRRLDGSVAREADGPECRQAVAETPAGRERWRRLAALDAPASAERRAQRQSIRRALLEELQESVRQTSSCVASDPPRDTEVRFRAVPLPDEILLLRQAPSGEVAVARRTSLERTELVRRTAAIREAMEHRTLDDTQWEALLQPLAQALVPDPADLGPVTTFAVHGALQSVPLAALPVPAGREGRRWLGELTTVASRPAGAEAVPAHGAHPRSRLFVVDPSRNLASGQARLYRSLFPDARLLEGEEATTSAVERALSGAHWLHVDAHARYDPAFPELSTLALADGPLAARRLVERGGALVFANLSACRSGSWPPTADSGRFGLAGLLARRGVPWVIGARTDLEDRVAVDFNRALYERLALGDDVPGAYAAASRTVGATFPAVAWAGLVLLQAEPVDSGGQSALARTLDEGTLPVETAAGSPDRGVR